jgi:hypothetical protein
VGVPEIDQVLAMVALDESGDDSAGPGDDQLWNWKQTCKAAECTKLGIGSLVRVGSVVHLANPVRSVLGPIRITVLHRHSIPHQARPLHREDPFEDPLTAMGVDSNWSSSVAHA